MKNGGAQARWRENSRREAQKQQRRWHMLAFGKGAGGVEGVSRCFWLTGPLSIITLSLFFVRDCPHRSTPGPLSDRQEVHGGGSGVQKVCVAG